MGKADPADHNRFFDPRLTRNQQLILAATGVLSASVIPLP